jgi:multidrug efflux pump subunit AcrB
MHYDTTRFVSAAMHDVLITLGEALLLVVAVVFVFLQSWRTTIIPTIAIPVSLVATLAVMEILGFSLNMLSLLCRTVPLWSALTLLSENSQASSA